MAERRMFAKTIIDSDAFLEMPLSSQALYFHLSMRADDEGFLNNPKKIQRMIGASEDDAKLLIAKNFIIPFESGVVVIKHWKIHNYIQSDRFKPTVYREERAELMVKDNKAYTKIAENVEIPTMYPERIQNGDTGKVRLGKDSIGKDRLGNIYSPADAEQIIDYLNEICGTSYRANTRKTVDLIKARMNEGFTVEDFKTVIYKKAKQWKDDKIMCQYLRPITLFSPKFESYLNEKEAGGRLDWLDGV